MYFDYCIRVVALKDKDPYQTREDMPDNNKVVTSFPNIARKYFESKCKKAVITEVAGATEITPRLGLADVIVDITSSGSTLKMNKLRIIDEILESSATIIGRPGVKEEKKDEIETFIRAIKSAITAENKNYLMANIPKKSLPKVKAFLPGLTSPTVVTLLDHDA